MTKKPKVERDVENEKRGGVDLAIKMIKTKFGDDSIVMLGEKPKVGVDAVSTGSLGLDIYKTG